jgi:hypothetical protein
VQGRTGSPDILAFTPKGNTAMSFYLLLAVVSVAGLVASVVVTARDGYRRQPRETFARTV